jgi:hypothetical protein
LICKFGGVGLNIAAESGVFGGVRAVFWNFLEFFGKVLIGVQKLGVNVTKGACV